VVAGRALFAAGLCLFLLSTREWIPLAMVSPDLGVYVVLCIGTALLLRICSGRRSAGTFGFLGLVLGCGYLVKTIMFPVALVFLGIGWLVILARKADFAKMLLCSSVFVLVAAPFVAAISLQKGRLTIGDSGKANFIMMQGKMSLGAQNSGEASAPFSAPRVHELLGMPYFTEYANPVAGTDPKHYDPSYWWDGATVHFSLAAQCKGVARAMLNYNAILLQIGFLIVPLIILLLLHPDRRVLSGALLHQWPVLAAGFVGLALYALVIVEERYVAGFVALVVLGLFSASRLPEGIFSAKLDRAIALGMFAMFCLAYGPRYTYEGFHSALDLVKRGDCPQHRHTQWEVATALGRFGIKRGDCIGTIFVASDAYYARLAGVKIVADLSVGGAEPDFSTIRKLVPKGFTDEGGLREEVLAAFANAGAKAVIAQDVPSPERERGWTRLGDSNYYMLALKR
jgi:hypothetical protein